MLNIIKEKLLYIVVVLLIIAMLSIHFLASKLIAAENRAEDSDALYHSTKVEVTKWKDKDSLNHAQVEIFALNNKKAFKEDALQTELLNVLSGKVAKLDGYRVTGTSSHYYFSTKIKDTTINDTVHIKKFSQADPKGYYVFNGIIVNDSIRATLFAPDTLVTGISKCKSCKGRKKFLFIRYDKPLQVEIVNKNPFVEVTYHKEVYLKKEP